MDRDKLIDYIVKNVDQDWINDFIYYDLEINWIKEIQKFPEDTLLKWARELGYVNPEEDY